MKTTSRKKVTLLAGLLAGVAALGLAITTTSAVFTASVSNGSNTFTSGSVTMTVQNGDATVYAPFNVTAMAPGSVQYKAIRVNNSGTLDMRYNLASTPTALTPAGNGPALAAALNVGVKRLASGNVCDATTYTAGTVVTAETAGSFGTAQSTAVNVFGSAVQGNQTGDRVLAAGANEVLCFKVELPSAATSSVSGATATYSFAWNAEQTVNNP